MKTTYLVIVLLVVTFSFAHAHNLWIETASNGQSGKEHRVKVFLGGYGENERDSTNKWFSNTSEFALWLVLPDGTKKQLNTQPSVNYSESIFTPDKEGYYTLLISHEVKEVFGSTRYHYFSAAQVAVGKALTGQDHLGKFSDFSIQLENNPEVAKPITLLFQVKGENLDKAKAVVNAPSGWNKNLQVNLGTTTFDAGWPGLYVAAARRKKAPGMEKNLKKYNM